MLSNLAEALSHYQRSIELYREAEKKYGPYASLAYETENVEDAEKHYLNALTEALGKWRPEQKGGEPT